MSTLENKLKMVVRQISSQEEFKGLLVGSSEKLVVIDFYAVWCGPCKLISPEIDKLSESHSSVIFGKVDVDQLDSIAAEAGVNAMPTFHFYKGGKKVDEVIGANLNAIKEKIQKHAISVSSGNRVGGEATSSSNSNISGDKKLLIEMGFPEWKVTKALKATKNAGLQPALDWLDQHANDVEQEEDVDNNGGAGGGNRVGSEPASEVPEANSLVCDDCGKLFRSSDLAQFHATKTGHSNFSQSVEEVKPLTEEEKAAQLEKARILLREKQEQQRLKDIEQAKENERIRRKAGKDAQEFRDRKAQEDMRIAAEQRRKEKIEDLQQRARIKAQIEQDRLDKARRLQGGIFLDSTSKNTEPTSSSSTAPKSTSDSCRIQVRFSDGLPPFTGTFKAEDTLKTVFEKVAEYRSSKGKSNSSVAGKLSTNVPPRRVLDCAGSEGDKSLSELGLLPSSLLIYQ